MKLHLILHKNQKDHYNDKEDRRNKSLLVLQKWRLFLSSLCFHEIFFFSSDAQKSKAGMNATAQQGQKANVPERAPTAILGVTCEAKKEEYFYYIIS